MMRKIIHIDMDCFYAAIEQRDDPDLANMPVAVGGSPDGRGVVSTCNYAARRFGVHSAMPAAQARRLCPELIFVKTNMVKYKAESTKIREIFHRYTELVEPLSLDEAYLDVTDSPHCHGSATWIAQSICKDIADETRLTASAGVATTKFLAKVASDWNKPNGIKVVLPEEQMSFIDQLPVKKLYGVGKVMTAKLESMDIFDCKELRQVELNVLIKKFGKTGKYLYDLCRGVDKRQVKPRSDRKSLSVETTFSENLSEWQDCENTLHRLISNLSRRLGKTDKIEKIRKVYVKVKSEKFEIHSAESISIGLDIPLLVRLLKRLREQYPEPIRLMGIGVRFPQTPPKDQYQQIDIPF
ncbi:DNA polymerase IV [Aliikangiella marina]|uniref:DNA polymerase IV n=2 Tax=Aliikangiella marina TaxID=1712262 RepID=A0A545TDE2_9GAMM|nr:DNA polymerase IV [Aliikangiella marina]